MKLFTGLTWVLALGLVSTKPSKQFQAGFMDNMNFDDFIHTPQIPGQLLYKKNLKKLIDVLNYKNQS